MWLSRNHQTKCIGGDIHDLCIKAWFRSSTFSIVDHHREVAFCRVVVHGMKAFMVKLAIMGDCGQVPSMHTSDPLNSLPPLSSDAPAKAPAPGGQTKSYQFFGERIRCSSERLGNLRERILSKRSECGSWTRATWKSEMKRIAAEGWGVAKHGGCRRGVIAEHCKRGRRQRQASTPKKTRRPLAAT